MTATATVWQGSGFDVTTAPLPEPGNDELVVQVELATVCGSDLHTTSGRRSTAVPTVLGHEAVGRVVAAGAGSRVAVGDRVVWAIGTACGRCDRCRCGLSQKCTTVRKYGHERIDDFWWLNGTFASHVHLVPGTGVVVVPDRLPAALLAPAGCATATVTAAARRVGLRADDSVLVIGCGMLGLTAVAYAHHLGATRVVACDVDPSRRELAAALGAVTCDQDDLRRQVADVVLELSGHPDAVAAALHAADLGGRVALVGSVSPGRAVPVDPERVVRNLLTITGSHNYRHDDLVEAVDFLTTTRAADLLTGLVSEPVPLHRITDAFARAATRGAPRVSVRPDGAP